MLQRLSPKVYRVTYLPGNVWVKATEAMLAIEPCSVKDSGVLLQLIEARNRLPPVSDLESIIQFVTKRTTGVDFTTHDDTVRRPCS